VNRLHKGLRLTLYALFGALLATGIAWEAMSPGAPAALLMKIHGAAAMLTLVLLGMVLAQHVPTGWAAQRNRQSGAVMLGAAAWLAVTGYLLYYAGGEALRWYAAQSHLWVGIAAAAIGGFHVRRTALP
jgi:hypothetical protein